MKNRSHEGTGADGSEKSKNVHTFEKRTTEFIAKMQSNTTCHSEPNSDELARGLDQSDCETHPYVLKDRVQNLISVLEGHTEAKC